MEPRYCMECRSELPGDAPEAGGRAREIEGIVNDPGLRSDLIGRHQCDRLGLEVPLAGLDLAAATGRVACAPSRPAGPRLPPRSGRHRKLSAPCAGPATS